MSNVLKLTLSRKCRFTAYYKIGENCAGLTQVFPILESTVNLHLQYDLLGGVKLYKTSISHMKYACQYLYL